MAALQHHGAKLEGHFPPVPETCVRIPAETPQHILFAAASNVDAAAKSRAIRIADFATGAKLQPRIHMVSATGL